MFRAQKGDMMPGNAASKRIETPSGSVPVHVKSLSLADGWAALVVTGVGGAAAAIELPAVDDWRVLLERLSDDPTALPGHAVLKWSEKGVVLRARLEWAGKSVAVVCKRSRVRGFRRRMFAAWRPCKERVNFERGLALLRAGIATAFPLAVLQRRGSCAEAWLITEFVEDVVDLDQVALVLLPQLEPSRQRAVKNAIIEALAGLCDLMHRHGFSHRDLKASNILLTNWDSRKATVRPCLVDLEGLRLRGAMSARRRRQPLIRLAASLLGYTTVTRTDFCRFLQAYLTRSGIGTERWKQHFHELAKQASNYTRRAQRRKTDKLDGYTGR
ncbi:MAG: hypothetical protein KAV82_00280 [Phycisphaerae bacterium]|nr:hypothetical protein [Phycisphaerae bacterium]